MDFGFIFSSALGEIYSPTTAAYALAALGLAVHFGYSGLLNFGQAGFMAVGAYGFAISTLTFKAPFFVALLIAILCSVIFAFILGIPTLRLRADYLAIVTIASAEIVRYVVTTNQLTSVTGSANGLAAFEGDFYSMNPFPEGSYLGMNNRDFFIRVVGWTLVIICCLLVGLLMRSPWGRVLKGIREDENAVRSLGKNVYAYKMQALVIGGVLGALAGMIFTLPRRRPAVQLWNRTDVLPVDLPPARRHGYGARAGDRRHDLLGCPVPDPEHPVRPHRVGCHHVADHCPSRPVAVHPCRCSPDAPDDLPPARRLRQ